jgi:predicted secreted hydrolase
VPPARLTRRAVLAGLASPAAWTSAAAASPPGGVHPRPLHFPADFGAHPDTRTEWWYVTGELHAGGDTWGFQVTFFRSRTELGADNPSRFAARQLLFAHAALTDLQARRLRHDQRIARQGFGIARAAEGDTAVALRDWQLHREGPVDASRYLASVASDSAGFALELAMSTPQPPLLQGEAGYSRKGPRPGEASHYYSRPQLQVAGHLRLDGRRVAVNGRAWLDHEWSDAFLNDEAVGWDWIGMNLDSGEALTAFRLRRADGSSVYAGGSWRDAGGATRSFGPDEVRFTPGRVWTSPASRARYPVEWTIDVPAGPRRCTVRALLDNQELDSRASTGSVYWEGLSVLADSGGRALGRGYLEMTGYASALKL